jgi:LacI family transcriptional regulator
VGVDNDLSKCELGSPALSSIELNTNRAGYSAAALMHQWMRQEPVQHREPVRVEPVRVVERQSTQIAAVPDEIVIRALDYIRSQADRLIQVRDVADSVFISRRELERRFKKYLNHSIHQEIKIARVDFICRLLLETSDTISEIAARLGFSDAAHIGRYFKDIKGISPSEFRRKNLCTV